MTAMERRAGRQAVREGRPPAPVTEVGRHNAIVREKRGLRRYVERGTGWLREQRQQMSARLHGLAKTLTRAMAADQREQARAREAQEREKRQRQIETQRSHERTRRPGRDYDMEL